MDLLTLEYIKEQFPAWESFIKRTASETAEDLDDRLTMIADRAEAEFSEYLVVAADDMTDALKMHLINIIRKGCFDVKNSANSFETKPQIIRDYERSMLQLEKYRQGLLRKPIPDGEEDSQLDVTMKKSTGTFASDWFNQR